MNLTIKVINYILFTHARKRINDLEDRLVENVKVEAQKEIKEWKIQERK